MDLKGVREALHRQPFRPFTIYLADGRSEVVKHPDFVAVGPTLVVVIHEDNSWSSFEPLLIVSLNYDPPEKRKGGNGSPKKKRPGS